MEFRYAVIPVSELTQAMLDACPFVTQPREATDGGRLMKWAGADPSIFDGYTKYDQSQIDVKLKDPEWNPSMQIT